MMMISLGGVLSRAADACKRSSDSEHLAFSLELLLKHLKELKEKPSEVEAFFQVWSTTS